MAGSMLNIQAYLNKCSTLSPSCNNVNGFVPAYTLRGLGLDGY